jgi:hypothetical protein
VAGGEAEEAGADVLQEEEFNLDEVMAEDVKELLSKEERLKQVNRHTGLLLPQATQHCCVNNTATPHCVDVLRALCACDHPMIALGWVRRGPEL